jgi:hypothetical protein
MSGGGGSCIQELRQRTARLPGLTLAPNGNQAEICSDTKPITPTLFRPAPGGHQESRQPTSPEAHEVEASTPEYMKMARRSVPNTHRADEHAQTRPDWQKSTTYDNRQEL